jgi:hypothetical protein
MLFLWLIMPHKQRLGLIGLKQQIKQQMCALGHEPDTFWQRDSTDDWYIRCTNCNKFAKITMYMEVSGSALDPNQSCDVAT